MNIKKMLFRLSAIAASGIAVFAVGLTVKAAPVKMADGQYFDATYYAQKYPDVVAVFGYDQNMLYLHYSLCGKTEGRLPYDPSFKASDNNSNSSGFDAAYYAARYPDVAAVFGNDPAMLKLHYDLCGKAEGRFASAAEEAAFGAPLPAPAPLQTTVNDNSVEIQVLNLVNAERAKYGLSPLSYDPANLAPGAAVRAREIVTNFSHTRPDGRSCFTAISIPGAVGENIAAGYSTPSAVMTGWMNSSGHRANILSSKYHKLGVGYVYAPGSPYGYYWVQMFSS